MLVFVWLGGGLSVAYTAPQILHMWRSKSADGVSALSMWVRVVSLVLYIVHGVMIMDPPLIVMSALAASQSLVIIALKKKYRGEYRGESHGDAHGVANPPAAVEPCVASTAVLGTTTTAVQST